jgi:hypothetical protein
VVAAAGARLTHPDHNLATPDGGDAPFGSARWGMLNIVDHHGRPYVPARTCAGRCRDRLAHRPHRSRTGGYTVGMTTKIGVSLPDSTYARALEMAKQSGTTVSGLVNEALLAELARRAAAAHAAMLAEAEDPDRLARRAAARGAALAAWKHAG